MKLKKTMLAIAAGALSLTLGAVALVGCAGGKEYTFEAEHAKLEGMGNVMGQTEGPASISQETSYMFNGELVEDATLIGVENFNTAGQKIIWTVVSSKACKAQVTLYAASSSMWMDQEGGVGLSEINMADTEAYAIKCNGETSKLTGKLPGYTFEGGWMGMQQEGVWWNIGTVTANINLKEGENTVSFEIVDAFSQMGSGINVDKIVIKASAELSAKSN